LGKGSPRLLRQLVFRTAVGALAALAFAPSAFADGNLIGASVAAGPVTVTASVAPTGVDVSTSVTTPAAPVATPVAKPHLQAASAAPHHAAAITVRSDGGTAVQAAVSVSTPAIPQRPIASAARTTSRHATPVAKHRTTARPVSRPRLSHERGSADALPQAAALPRSFPQGFHVQSAEMRAPAAADLSAAGGLGSQLPAPELPLAPGSTAAGAVGSGTGLALLLLVLAAELALMGLPRLGRRVLPLFPAARPYPYVLQLERPD
jgi:hypothetical protein